MEFIEDPKCDPWDIVLQWEGPVQKYSKNVTFDPGPSEPPLWSG